MSDLVTKINALLAGKKTYIGAAGLALATFAVTMNWIDQATFSKIQAVLIAWIGASIRAAIQ